MAERMLGKQAPKVDKRTLKLEKYIKRMALPPIPASTNYRDKIASWPMYLNDRIGDCVADTPETHVKLPPQS